MQRLSTHHVPERQRLAFVHDFVARHVAGLQFTPVGDRDLHIELAAFGLPGGITVGTASYSPILGARTRELMGDGRDNYLLTIHTHEHEVSVEGRASVKVAAGDVMIINEGVESRFRLPETVVNVVSLGRADLARLVPFIDRDPAYHVSRDAPGVSLMAGYADLLRRAPPRGDKAEGMAANHLYDLVALTLDGMVKGGAGRNDQSIRAARLELVKRDMLDRLRNPHLTVESVARRQGVTVRYIHRLFEAEGVTFSEFLRDSRLELAYRALRMTPAGSATIASIAFDAGFCDLSSFNRAFRRCYGVTPSEVRSQGMRDRGA